MAKEGQVYRTAIADCEAGGPVEPHRRDVPNVDGQFQPRDVGSGQIKGMVQYGQAEPAAARRRS